MKAKEKALVLFSGGLDSRLALKIMQEQLGEKNVLAINFILPFGGGCNSKEYCIKNFAEKHKAKLFTIDCTSGKLFKEYMQMIIHPKFQRGSGLNPCLDCHIFMLKKAKELANKKRISIIATGEVLGERPLSQTKKALSIIDKELGFQVLRPLSALLLDETIWEKKGIIDRKKLLDIQGRKRSMQIKLAEKHKINYPSPGGGCLLCEKGYCKKLKPILNSSLNFNDIRLLSAGRHFNNSEIILGRNEEENALLEKQQGIKIIPQQPGATALLKTGKHDLIEAAKKLIQKYSRHKIREFRIIQ